jgi:hypothetical protein
MNTAAQDDLPEDPLELAKLARLLNYPDGVQLLTVCRELRAENRGRFERIFASV